MVERRCLAHEPCLSQVLVRPRGAGFVAGYSAALSVCFMNRPMPNGTSGGVGGRRERSRLLPDSPVAESPRAVSRSIGRSGWKPFVENLSSNFPEHRTTAAIDPSIGQTDRGPQRVGSGGSFAINSNSLRFVSGVTVMGSVR